MTGEKPEPEVTALCGLSIFLELIAAYDNRLSKPKLNLKGLLKNI